jgi:hypothetical protein
MVQFKFTQKDKEDLRLSAEDQAAYEKACKSSFRESIALTKLGVAAKGIEEFLMAWKYR